MKILESDLSALREAIAPIIVAHPEARAQYREAGLSEERYRWDILHASRFNTATLYAYLDDSNIDSALRAILGKGN